MSAKLRFFFQKPTKKDPSKFIKTGTIEDLTDRIGFVVFPKVVESFGELIQSDQKVILKAKVNIRDEEINLIVNEVKPIENVNLVTIKMLQHLEMEENIYLKELLAKYKGENPVVIEFSANDLDNTPQKYQMLTSNHLWVDLDGNVQNEILANFKDKLQIEVKALG